VQICNANLNKADLVDASLCTVMLDNSDLTDADLTESLVIGLLNNANLRHARLKNANLGADIANQDMTLARVEMKNVMLNGIDLSCTNL
jgi:uncharacterized protein YjbI with pentapeptide repeats